MNYDIGFSTESGSYGQGSANAKSRTQPFPSEVYSKSYKIYGRKRSERGWSRVPASTSLPVCFDGQEPFLFTDI